MADVTTQDYLDVIQAAKENGHTVNIDFSSLPKGVDSKAVSSAMAEGLSDAHGSALDDAADKGHQVALDFAAAHPILDTVEKTAELGGMTAGGMAGAGAGAMTSALTGPAGPVAGAVAGAGLGYGAVKSGADALNESLGLTPPRDMGTRMSDAASDVATGGKTQATGMAAGAVVGKSLEALKGAYPYAARLLTKIPLSVGRMFMADPEIPAKYAGTESSVTDAVSKVQDSLETLHDNASKVYSEALDKLGLSGPKTADEAAMALSEGEGKSISQQSIAEKWVEYKTNPNLNDHEKLALLSDINQDINSHLKWAKAGQSLDPVSNKLTPYLQTLKTGVQKELDTVPGGTDLKQADDVWHNFRQIYNSLQPQLKDAGQGAKWLTNVVSDATQASNTPKALLETLDKVTGSTAAADAQKEVVSNILKKPLADTMMGKLTAVMALAHPARALTLPLVGAAQSPLLQTTAMRGASAMQALLAMHPQIAPTLLMGMKQAQASLPNTPGPDNVEDLVDSQGH